MTVHSLLLSLAAILVLATSAVAQAQPRDLAEFDVEFERLFDAGRYQEAEPLAREVLALREMLLGSAHPDVATSLNDLAELLRLLGRDAESEPLHRRSLAIREQALGPEHAVVAASLNNLALVLQAQRRYAEAEPLHRRSLSIKEKEGGSDHRGVSRSLNNLAMLFQAQGRYADAEPLHRRSLDILEKAFGPDHPDVAMSLNNLALVFQAQRRYADAEPLHRRSLSIKEKALGPDHPDVAMSLNNLAQLLQAQGGQAEAERFYRRSLSIWEKTLGPDHSKVALSLGNLATLLQAQGRHVEAEQLYRRSLRIWENMHIAEHPDFAIALFNLASLLRVQGRYADAELLNRRGLGMREKLLGGEHPDVARALNELALVIQNQGHYAEAEPLHRRSLGIREKALGATHSDVAESLNNLAFLLQQEGRYAESEPLHRRGLSILEKLYGPEHWQIAHSLNNLGMLLAAQGRGAEAERLYQRSLEIWEKSYGLEHPLVALSLGNLAELFRGQGRHADAEPLYRRSWAITEKAFGPERWEVGMSINNLALALFAQGRHIDAEPFYRRSLQILDKALGPMNPLVAMPLNNLAESLRMQGRHTEAEPLHARSLEILTRAHGPEHPLVAMAQGNLAALLYAQGRVADAVSLLRNNLTIQEHVLGPEHPAVAFALANLGLALAQQRQDDDALPYVRRAVAIVAARMGKADAADKGMQSEQRSARELYLHHLALTTRLAGAGHGDGAALYAEGFTALQLSKPSNLAAAVTRMTARFAAGSDALAAAVRARQDGQDRLDARDALLLAAVSKRPAERDLAIERRLRAERDGLRAQLRLADADLADRFPRYVELASPKPATIAQIQALLVPGETLLAFAVAAAESHVFAMTRERVLVERVALTAEELRNAVQKLRGALDPTGRESLAQMPPFDAATAYMLYAKLLAPAEALLRDARHLMVVTDGALDSLPIGVLLTQPPASDTYSRLEEFRQAPWLARTYAVSVLPSIGSLRALRNFEPVTRARQPFLGIGDPLLDRYPSTDQRGPSATSQGWKISATRGSNITQIFRGASVDQEALRRLPSLPESAEELAAIAQALGREASTLMLRDEATEVGVKRTDLSRYRVIAFATHGVLSGEIGAAEAGLVLTPPNPVMAEDDGLLTASEIAQLKLDADWVILSACNTAASDGSPGGEGLSGLAKAFAYAGARTLFVSHWTVASEATVKLTTTMLQRAVEPGVMRADAHRFAMLSLLDDAVTPEHAHPVFWAPFVIVGDGRAGS